MLKLLLRLVKRKIPNSKTSLAGEAVPGDVFNIPRALPERVLSGPIKGFRGINVTMDLSHLFHGPLTELSVNGH